MKRQATNWAMCLAKCLPEKELVSRIYKEFLQLTNKKSNKQFFKHAKDVNSYFTKDMHMKRCAM